jgi:hypothetical protein
MNRKLFTLIALAVLAAGCSCNDDAVAGDADADTPETADPGTDDQAENLPDPEPEEDTGDAPADLDAADMSDEELPPPACPDDGLADIEVSAAAGEQIVPKAALLPDGRTWFSWYSNESGNYNVRLQLLDVHGEPLLDPAGILVSDHASDTWVTDYSMAADASGAAVIAFNDVRSGTFNVFAYRVTPEGEFAWGDDGVALVPGDYDNMFPKIALTSSGEAVFVWERFDSGDTVTQVVAQRLSGGGEPLWGDGVVISGADGLRAIRPQVAAAGDDVILVWMETADIMSLDRDIFARKLDAAGSAVWDDDAVVVDDQELPFFYDAVVEPDDGGGLFVAWTALVGVTQAKSYVQHIDGDGAATMPAHTAFSTSGTTQQYSPAMAYAAAAGELVAAWREEDMDQTVSGIYAQRFTTAGERGWEDGGLELVPPSSARAYMGGMAATPDGAVIVYSDMAFGTVDDLRVQGGRLVLEDAPAWSPVVLSDFQSSKGHPAVDGSSLCGCWIAWDDGRSDLGDIRAGFFLLR